MYQYSCDQSSLSMPCAFKSQLCTCYLLEQAMKQQLFEYWIETAV